MKEAPFIDFPHLTFTVPSLESSLIMPFLVSGLAAALRTVGVVTTAQKINDAEWKRPQNESIKKGILADGLGCFFGGMMGVSGLSSSPSSVGISQVTGATSRAIAYAILGWFFLLACLPKVTAIFVSIPLSVVGGTLLYTGSMMLVSGIQIVTSTQIDVRKTFIIGISLFLGISHELFPAYYKSLPYIMRIFTGTFLSITTISSLLLNALFRIKQREMTVVEIGESEKTSDQIDTLILQHMQKWGITPQDAQSTASFVNSICRLIREGRFADGPIKATIGADDFELRIDLLYTGKLLHIPINRPETEEEMLDEMPMARGLSGFLSGVFPDHVSCTANNASCHIKLVFDL
jgi:xanthine permease XanP